jgi:hypothetical protein
MWKETILHDFVEKKIKKKMSTRKRVVIKTHLLLDLKLLQILPGAH